MILFHLQTKIKIDQKAHLKKWIKHFVQQHNKRVGDLNFIFCTDEFLLDINQKYLQHDTYTDIITFDYSENQLINGDIFISTERIKENAETFKVDFNNELLRVIAHGVLHLCGYKDKTKKDKEQMTNKENQALSEYEKIL